MKPARYLLLILVLASSAAWAGEPEFPGLKAIMSRFKQVITIENNWSDRLEDPIIDEENRRYSQLAFLLRSRTLVDIDCWSEAKGQPIKPSTICAVARERLSRTR